MAHKLVARLSTQSNSTDREYSPSRDEPEDDLFGDVAAGDKDCCCSDSMAEDEEDADSCPSANCETFSLDVFSKEFTNCRIYRAIVRGHLAALYHAVYCLREPVTVIDTNFGVNYIHLVMTTASPETESAYAPFVYALSNFRVDVCHEDVGGDTPLRLAIRRGLVELVRAALRCGAEAPDSDCLPALLPSNQAACAAVKSVCEDFQPGLWVAVAAADYFLVDRLIGSWCRIRVARQGDSLISFARRSEAGSLIVDLLETSRPTLEFVHATLAGDQRKMLELLGNKNVNADTFDRGYRPAPGAPCQPRSLKAAAADLGHYHVLYLLPDAKKGSQPSQPHQLLASTTVEPRHPRRQQQQHRLQHRQQLMQAASVTALAAAASASATGAAAASPLAAAVAASAACASPARAVGDSPRSQARRGTSTMCAVM